MGGANPAHALRLATESNWGRSDILTRICRGGTTLFSQQLPFARLLLSAFSFPCVAFQRRPPPFGPALSGAAPEEGKPGAAPHAPTGACAAFSPNHEQ